MENNFEMTAKTLFGFEDLLADELKNLGAQKIQKGVRNVSFWGDKGFMYKANIACRTALKIMVPIHRVYAKNKEELYSAALAFDWSKHISLDKSFAINATVHSDYFKHTQYVALKTKDAIVDQFRKRSGRRPNVNTEHPDVALEVHINADQVTFSLDSSGKSLHHRGYRSATNIAPINEVLAAGMLLHSGWKGQSDFLDPMCGSGTIPIEAAMIAANIPANSNRSEFAFEKWDDFDVDLFETIFDALMNKVTDFPYKILGFDKAPSAIAKARENAKNARLEDFITWEQADFFTREKPVSGTLHMVFNPPYGERLQADIPELYKNIGDTLKQHYPDTHAWLITTDPDGMKNLGLRPSRKIKIFNGGLEGRFLYYPMYAGSKKEKFNKN
jgi:putative N6-adenine-specific DNA methylase